MNKKFSTLVAGLAMVTAVSAAAISKTGDGYTMLRSSSNDYLAVYGAKADSVVVKNI
ncbi:hypothetical protein [Parabacteroides sp.]